MSDAEPTVGQTVARARTDAGMTVAQVAESTRIRGTLISAIENDDFRLCGGDVYSRGHLKSIAAAVGIDPVALVAQFDAERGKVRTELAAVAPITQPTHVMEGGTSRGLGALAGTLGASVSGRRGPNWSAVMAVALLVIVAVGAVSLLTNRPSGTPTAALPTPSVSSSSTPPGSESPTPDPSVSSSPSDDPIASADGVVVKLTVTGRASWVRATSQSGESLFEGTLTKGTTKTFRDDDKVLLLIGNAGAVSLKVNGRDLGAPGSNGQVIKTEFVPGDPTGQAG